MTARPARTVGRAVRRRARKQICKSGARGTPPPRPTKRARQRPAGAASAPPRAGLGRAGRALLGADTRRAPRRIVGVICPDCLTLREQRAIRAEKARVIRRLKRGLPSSRGFSAVARCFLTGLGLRGQGRQQRHCEGLPRRRMEDAARRVRQPRRLRQRRSPLRKGRGSRVQRTRGHQRLARRRHVRVWQWTVLDLRLRHGGAGRSIPADPSAADGV
jgi:hypothetical protein